jgi:hypothetical protein
MMEAIFKQGRRLKGHKLVRSWKGAHDAYAMGRCECGEWRFVGWSDRMEHVRNAHQSHLTVVLMRREKGAQ